MKCPKCKKDFEAGVKAAYKLGLVAGKEDQSRILWVAVNRIKKTLGHLFDEIQRCDRENPLECDPNYVHITIRASVLKEHIRKMRKHNKDLARYYRDKLKEHQEKIYRADKHIIKVLNCRI